MKCEIIDYVLVCNCEKGFEFKNQLNSSTYQMCDDVDECKTNSLICGSNAICLNEYGSYSCECIDGFLPKYETKFVCEDFDECSSECSHNCDQSNSFCVNTIGAYKCDCKNGFVKNEQTNQCIDVDECNLYAYFSNEVNNCHGNSKCFNTFGSYKCVCEPGFYGNGSHCEDINECIDVDIESICNIKQNSVCINLIGSYECRCLDGFHSLSNQCVDADECTENLYICSDNSICHNLIGSYSCECSTGYIWSKMNQRCEDLNECISGSNTNDIYYTNICDDSSICVNTIGSYECQCKSGWNKTDSRYCSGKQLNPYQTCLKSIKDLKKFNKKISMNAN